MQQETWLLISDLWGAPKANYLSLFREWAGDAKLTFCDACALAGLDLGDYREEALHRQFVEGGIERAVAQLLKESGTIPVNVLGLSVGGTIAWKAFEAGLPVKQLVTISATRLRYETVPPSHPTRCIFGENDPYRPTNEWFAQMGLELVLVPKQGHEVYRSPDCLRYLPAPGQRG